MARPKTHRMIHTPPLYKGFKPIGARGRDLETLEMSIDEYESLRLADFEGLNQEEAAEEMDISRSTFARLIESARKKSSQFFIQGKRLVIGGGSVHFKENLVQCHDCHHIFAMRMGESLESCHVCGSTNLIDMAGGFGHGRCCQENQGAEK
ncbi:MAG: DNA-binding protein [Spirochaetes bacterium]|nr:MAG: DNA-binding protein [Spirochaetota bacterium]RKX85724.1 MAG: DNA-binding protein [Spirochaetota bacterium]RKX96797.1 MAG: DNA-binding protein [Spirochaetota bacterium]